MVDQDLSPHVTFRFGHDTLRDLEIPAELSAVRFLTAERQEAIRLTGGDLEGPVALFIPIPDALGRKWSGAPLRVRVTARAERGGTAARFAVAYSSLYESPAAWNWFQTGKPWKNHVFELPSAPNVNRPCIAILPDERGQPGVEVLAVFATRSAEARQAATTRP